MSGVNNVILIGNLGKDPEFKYTPNGTAVANFSLAINEKRGDKDHTEWVRIVAWGKLADICGEHLKKGKQVYIEGKLQTRKWDKDGQTHYTTEVVAQVVKFLGSNDGNRGREEVPTINDDDISF